MALRASKAASDCPDLVLMDIQLPMLDGYGEKTCETVMSSSGTSGAMPSYAQNFAWRLPRMCVGFCPLRVLRRASGPTITVC